jgi:putative transposase
VTFTDKKRIGTFKLVGGWDLNFYPVEEIKRFRLIKRADGYYCQFVVNVDVRQYAKPLEAALHCIGLDFGLKVFYTNSDGETVKIPRFDRKAEKRLNRLNRIKSKKFRKGAECTAACNPDLKSGLVGGQKQSNNYIKARKRYAQQHLKVSRKRKGSP